MIFDLLRILQFGFRNLKIEKTMKKIFIIVISLMIMHSAAFAGTTAPVFTDPDKPIEEEAGRTFYIFIKANPTTGYGWQLAKPIDEDLIKLVGSEYLPPDTDLVGAPGIEKWTFAAIRSGEATIVLKYVRPWEKDTSPGDVREFTVVIR